MARICLIALFVLAISVNAVPPLRVTRSTMKENDVLETVLRIEETLKDHRALGENLKKAAITMDKKIKLLDPIKGSIANIDERLAKVEKMMQNECHNGASSMNPAREYVISKSDFEELKNDVIDKLNNVVRTIDKIEIDIAEVQEWNRNLNNNAGSILEKDKCEVKLTECINKIESLEYTSSDDGDWKTKFQEDLDDQKRDVSKILSKVEGIETALEKLKDDSSIEDFDEDSKSICKYEKHQQETQKYINAMSTSMNEMKKEMSKLNIREVMQQTADSIIQAKNRVGIAAQQILAELKQTIKTSSKDITADVNNMFDMFEMHLLDDEDGVLTNFTSNIIEEISQVWRQISTMNQEIVSTKDSVSKIHTHIIDSCVVGTTMDDMSRNLDEKIKKMYKLAQNLHSPLEQPTTTSTTSEAIGKAKGTVKSIGEKSEETKSEEEIREAARTEVSSLGFFDW